ncbi:MAG: hypothetical protein KBA66_08445 [Leptospiraceae bacterium]|nr:hypothetical protein [Leptospiraceae bacterium]
MIILKSIFVVVITILAFVLIAFFGPFIIAQYDQNPAWSFIPMITIPIGIILGLIVGIVIVYKYIV